MSSCSNLRTFVQSTTKPWAKKTKQKKTNPFEAMILFQPWISAFHKFSSGVNGKVHRYQFSLTFFRAVSGRWKPFLFNNNPNKVGGSNTINPFLRDGVNACSVQPTSRMWMREPTSKKTNGPNGLFIDPVSHQIVGKAKTGGVCFRVDPGFAYSQV